MTIQLSDLSDNVVVSADGNYTITGNGVFDTLMSTVNTHLDSQFKLGRITGTDYATVYLGALQATVEQAVAFLLGMARTNAETSLLEQKEITEFAQTLVSSKIAPLANSVMGTQIDLQDKQAKSFVNNAKNKHLKTLTDMWSVNTSTAGVAATQITAINASGTGNLNEQISSLAPNFD